MKKVLLFLLISLFLISCAKEPKVEITSAEAFAFKLEEGWEINATARTAGFAQIEKENSDLYFTHLDYNINLYTPEDTLYDIDYDSVVDSTEEELIHIQVEAQIELDSGFVAGNYSIEFIVEDKYSSTKDTIITNCLLE